MTRALRMTASKPSKMRNKPTVVDGIRFGSQKEAKRYGELKLLEEAGAIQDLKVHVRHSICVNGILICRYEADFDYIEAGKIKLEDTKGRKSGPAWQMFQLKRKLMLAVHGINVEVI